MDHSTGSGTEHENRTGSARCSDLSPTRILARCATFHHLRRLGNGDIITARADPHRADRGGFDGSPLQDRPPVESSAVPE